MEPINALRDPLAPLGAYYEQRTDVPTAMIHVAMSDLLMRPPFE